MKYPRVYEILASGIFLFALPGYGIGLNEALLRVEKNAIEKKITAAEISSIESESKALSKAYDWSLSAETMKMIDESPSQNAALGNKRENWNSSISLQKKFSTGTIFKTTLTGTRNDLSYDETTPATMQRAINPEHTSHLEVYLSQPLWKGLNSKELKISKSMILSKRISPSYLLEIQMQAKKARLENLYWALAGLRSQNINSMKLLEMTEKYFELTKSSVKQGYMDEIELARSQSSLVNMQGVLIKINIAIRDIEQQIGYLIDPEGGKSLKLQVPSLFQHSWKVPALNLRSLESLALRHRLDLKQMEELKKPIRKSLELVKEQEGLTLDLFVKGKTNALEDTRSGVLANTLKTDNLTTAIGLNLMVPLGGSKVKYEKYKTEASIQKIEAEKLKIKQDIKQKLHFTLLEIKANKALKKQAEDSIESLKALKNIEEKKYKQARSSEMSILRYAMDILRSKNDVISAVQKIRQAETSLRLYTHSYKKAM